MKSYTHVLYRSLFVFGILGIWGVVSSTVTGCTQSSSETVREQTQRHEHLAQAEHTKQDGGNPTPCTGVRSILPDVQGQRPPEKSIPETIPPDQLCTYKPHICKGSSTPPWKLEDIQPQSCGYKKSYNLRSFRGYITVVALLSGW